MRDFTIKSSYDNLDIVLSEYLCDDAKANVLIVHGMIEHRKRYEDFANFLNSHGYNVYTFDKRGHGESTNKEIKHGFFSSDDGLNALKSDFLDIISYIKNISSLPLHIFAHSMGTIETRVFLQLNSHLVNKVVLSGAPNYQKGTKIGIMLAKLLSIGEGSKKSSKLLYNLSLGQFVKKVNEPQTNLDWLSYNKENIKKYQADEYCTFSFTNNGYLTLFRLVNQMHKYKAYLSTRENPIMFIYGKDDPCTGFSKGIDDSIRTLNKAGYMHIKKIELPNMRHEILNEVNKDEVYQKVLEFYEEW